MMNFEKKLIKNKSELLMYKKEILELFVKCFDQELDSELWDWAYIQNPNGDPIASLFFHEDKLVGHYAVIPISLICSGDEVRAVLSMTTMVDKAYRRYGLFIEQAEMVYEYAQSIGVQLVYGFPNKNSAPGFKKRLNWKIEDDWYIASLKREQFFFVQEKGGIKFNVEKKNNIDWRLSKPKQKYNVLNEGLILKEFGDCFDVVFFENESISSLGEGKYNVLLNSADQNCGVNYLFGYHFFDSKLKDAAFKVDLIMSDIF